MAIGPLLHCSAAASSPALFCCKSFAKPLSSLSLIPSILFHQPADVLNVICSFARPLPFLSLTAPAAPTPQPSALPRWPACPCT